MRKVKYGLFQDDVVQVDILELDEAMIGQNIAIKNMEREYAKTRSSEYYIIDEKNSIVRIRDASILEKMIARAKKLVSKDKNRVISRSNTKTAWDSSEEKLKDLSNPSRLYDTYDENKKSRAITENLDLMFEEEKQDESKEESKMIK